MVSPKVAGPVIGSQLPKALNLTLGNIQELIAEGEARNPGRELSRFVEANLPGGSLWYTRLAMERLIFDELEAATGREAVTDWPRLSPGLVLSLVPRDTRHISRGR